MYGAMALVIYIASILFAKGMITAGVITSFLFYIITLIWNIMIITHVWMNVSQVIGASDKLISIMNHKPKINSEGGVKI
jgi:ABC-type multidrug transport system fused ATPase/permease subunit